MRLLGCPICGKIPNVVDASFDDARVECRPTQWFGIHRNAHMVVYGRNVLNAVNEWNREVKDFWKVSNEPKEGQDD